MAINIVHLRTTGESTGATHPPGFSQGMVCPTTSDVFHNLSTIIDKLRPHNLENIFFTVAHHVQDGGLLKRSINTFQYQSAIGFDLDDTDPNRIAEYIIVLGNVLQIASDKITAWSTGNGIQCLVHLAEPIRSVQYFKELKPAYTETCRLITEAFKKENLSGYADPVIWDAARILRLPNTINSKPLKDKEGNVILDENGKKVFSKKEAILYQVSYTEYNLDLMAISRLDKYSEENIAPDLVRKLYPEPDSQEIVNECRFIQHFLKNPDKIHEPQAFDIFSLLSNMNPSSKIQFDNNEYTPKDLANYLFCHASSSDSLARTSFEDKWEGSSRYGTRKCSTISLNWDDACKSCPHNGRIPTPLALKSSQHIGSREMGYWVLSKNGKHLHPNYHDLIKQYRLENPYVVIGDAARIMAYDGKKYKPMPYISTKKWMMAKVNPSELARDSHYHEFLKLFLTYGYITDEEETALFKDSINGKINCQNGILNVKTGLIEPHNSRVGFQYVLPYDYTDGEMSEFFIEWLHTVTNRNDDLVNTLLDIMAYVLWPSYDDHMFVILSGDGQNGKSTLLRLIAAMVGDLNYSAMGLKHLATNRFASASLEGKLVNVCEENSGYKISLEETNLLKSLSDGGTVEAERKNVQNYKFKNTAKLIFSANIPPTFAEKGTAITRRMIVVPFDYKIQKIDNSVEKRLISELPGIVNLLIKRIQDNVKQNDGYFKVYRGGESGKAASEELLSKGESPLEWAKERMEHNPSLSVEGDYVEISAAYDDYREWSMRNGYSPMNKNNFSSSIYRFLIKDPNLKNKNIKSIEGKNHRVFKQCKLIQGEL